MASVLEIEGGMREGVLVKGESEGGKEGGEMNKERDARGTGRQRGRKGESREKKISGGN